jgi:hypothetical protein
MTNKAIALLLRSKGISEAEITSFIGRGQASPSISRILSPAQIQQVTQAPNPTTSAALGVIGNTIGGTAISKPMNQRLQSALGNSIGGTAISKPMMDRFNSALGGNTAGTPTVKPGASASSAAPRQNLLNRISDALNLRNKVVGGINNAAAGIRNTSQTAPALENTAPGTGLGEFPTGGEVTPYSAPEISMRDFTGEANNLAAEAYGPLFQAIEAGKTNAQGQYNTSDQVVKGLYSKLVSDTQASGVQQGQQYDQASQEAAGRAKALQDRQGQVYGESANTQTALLERLGQQQSAPQVIAGGLQEQAFQQSQAAQQGDAQQQYYQAGKQNSNDYTTGIANAQNTQGTVAREGLVRDLASVLSSFDNQALSGKSQQANTALDLANQLSSRDLQVQTANASNQMGAAQMNQSAQQQNLAAQQAAYQNAYGQQRDARSDFESDRNYGLQENQFKLDAASAAAKAQGAAGSAGSGYIPIGSDGFNSQSAPQQVMAQADSIDPGRGQEYVGLFNSIITKAQGNLDQYNLQSFASKAAQEAQAAGLSGAAAFAAAATFWKQVMNRS